MLELRSHLLRLPDLRVNYASYAHMPNTLYASPQTHYASLNSLDSMLVLLGAGALPHILRTSFASFVFHFRLLGCCIDIFILVSIMD